MIPKTVEDKDQSKKLNKKQSQIEGLLPWLKKNNKQELAANRKTGRFGQKPQIVMMAKDRSQEANDSFEAPISQNSKNKKRKPANERTGIAETSKPAKSTEKTLPVIASSVKSHPWHLHHLITREELAVLLTTETHLESVYLINTDDHDEDTKALEVHIDPTVDPEGKINRDYILLDMRHLEDYDAYRVKDCKQ